MSEELYRETIVWVGQTEPQAAACSTIYWVFFAVGLLGPLVLWFLYRLSDRMLTTWTRSR